MRKNTTSFALALRTRVRAAMLLIAMLCVAGGAWADQITTEEALQQAQDFLTTRTARKGQDAGTTPQLVAAGEISGLYVFNTADKSGFVIVSNDDATYPILGFSESGSLDPANIPSNMRAWLQGYADDIAWLQKQGAKSRQSGQRRAARRVGSHSQEPIAPLLSSQWNQGTPFNNLCPMYSSTERAVTGCVATAMAQVMYYHKWPQDPTKVIPGYITNKHGIDLSAGLPATTFDWANMLDNYKNSYNDTQATAVATLMQYCGYSVQMDYGEQSGASTLAVATALKTYFGYKGTTKFISRTSYTYDNWTDLIYFELTQQRPVVYGGNSTGGGHEFVCDGYEYRNGTDFFHINWGWGGTSDEYFVLSVLDPDVQGIGGSTTTDGYSHQQDAVIGIQKFNDTGAVADISPNNNNLSLNSMTLSSNPVSTNTTVTITANVKNNNTVAYEGEIGLGRMIDQSISVIYVDEITIPAGESRDWVIPFTPTQEGTYDFVLCYINSESAYVSDAVVGASLEVIANGGGSSSCRKPSNFTVSEIGNHSVVLSWTENGEATEWVIEYISENDEQSTTITVDTTPYTLTGLTPETQYAAQVTPVCDVDKPSEVIYWTTDVAAPAPTDLSVTPYSTEAEVSWNGFADAYDIAWAELVPHTPSDNARWLQYDDGTVATNIGNSDADTWTWGVMYPASMLQGYTYLYKVGIYENSYYTMDSYTVNIYIDGDNAPGTLVGTQTVTPTAAGMHEIELSSPVAIDPAQNLWITVTANGTYVLAACETTESNNQWVFNGSTWSNIGALSSNLAGFGWMIRGFIDNTAPSYVWNTVSGIVSPYTITGLEAEKDYIVRVKALYGGEDGESEWTYANFTTTVVFKLDDNKDNSAIITAYAGQPINVKLGRTLLADGYWNTFTVPFDLEPIPSGWTVMKLHESGYVDGTLTLTFVDETSSIEAGKPYLVKVNTDVVDPSFVSVTINKNTIETKTTYANFVPVMNPTTLEAGDHSVLFLGSANKLYYPSESSGGVTVKGFRAYFQLNGLTAGDKASARSIVLNFGNGEQTGVAAMDNGQWIMDNSVYDLQGRRVERSTLNVQRSTLNVQRSTLKKGVYIKNGRKVVIK